MQEIRDFSKTIVKKNWGHEYLAYENAEVGLWVLHINKNEKTSLHCHPSKDTGLVCVSGVAEISFMNDKTIVKAPTKMMIRKGLFHSTQALSEDVILFEIETPVLKHDLVRLSDSYGRALKPYESKENEYPKTPDCLWLQDKKTNEQFVFANRFMKMVKINSSLELSCEDEDILMCLGGGLEEISSKLKVYQPGNVINGKSFKTLANTFNVVTNTEILVIK